MTLPEVLGVLGFGLSAVLGVIKLAEVYDARSRLNCVVMRTTGEFGGQRDDQFEVLLTNLGAKTTTVTTILVIPYLAKGMGQRAYGQGESFLSDEMGLAHVTLAQGESVKFEFPFHKLNFHVRDGDRAVKANGLIARIFHTAAARPQDAVLR